MLQLTMSIYIINYFTLFILFCSVVLAATFYILPRFFKFVNPKNAFFLLFIHFFLYISFKLSNINLEKPLLLLILELAEAISKRINGQLDLVFKGITSIFYLINKKSLFRLSLRLEANHHLKAVSWIL